MERTAIPCNYYRLLYIYYVLLRAATALLLVATLHNCFNYLLYYINSINAEKVCQSLMKMGKAGKVDKVRESLRS